MAAPEASSVPESAAASSAVASSAAAEARESGSGGVDAPGAGSPSQGRPEEARKEEACSASPEANGAGEEVAKPPPSNDEVLERLAKQGVIVSERLTVCEQLGFNTTAKDHGHLGGLLAGKIGSNRFVAQYAIDGRAKCRHVKCNGYILAQELRIGKIPPSIKTGHSSRTHWYHAHCIFQSFRLVCKGTKIITDVADVEGFHNLQPIDQTKLRFLVAESKNELKAPLAADPIEPATTTSSHNKKRKAAQTGPVAKAQKPADDASSKQPGMHHAELESVLGLMVLGNADRSPEPHHSRPLAAAL